MLVVTSNDAESPDIQRTDILSSGRAPGVIWKYWISEALITLSLHYIIVMSSYTKKTAQYFYQKCFFFMQKVMYNIINFLLFPFNNIKLRVKML